MNITPLNHDSYLTLPSLAPDLQVMWLCFLWFFFDSCVYGKLLQSCLTLRDPVDCSLPGFSVHGILQARILHEILQVRILAWVAVSSSRRSSQPRDQTLVSCSSLGRQILYCWTIGEAFYWLSMYFISIYLFIYNSLFTVNNFKWRDK